MSQFVWTHTKGGVLTDCTTVKLSDPTGTYGVKRLDNDAVISGCEDGTDMTKDATGTYSHTWTDPANDLTYSIYVEWVYNGLTHRVEYERNGPTTTAVVADIEWTANLLTAQVRGELDCDPDAAGGTVPDRLKCVIKEAGVDLWRKEDWQYKLAVATLTTVVGDSDYDPQTDFHEMSQRWLNESSSSASCTGILFTADPIVYQLEYDRNPDRDNGVPRVAFVSQKSGSSHDWEILIEPPANAVYTYRYWYSRLDPWAASDLSDDSVPVWPLSFSKGWHLNATWMAEKAFDKSDKWEKSKKIFDDWLLDQKRENDETISTSKLEPITGDYEDLGARYSIAALPTI